MKVVKLEAENVKRLKAVSIEPNDDDSLVVIEGKNGQGKTSVLDSIAWALGGKRLIQDQPIREGEKFAEVMVDIGDYIVKRRWTQGGTTLELTTAKGAPVKSPQKILDGLIGEISFDPLEFSRMSAQDRIATLIQVADVDIDLDEYRRQRDGWYQERRDVNRLVKENEAALNAFDVNEPEMKLEYVDVSKVSEQLGAAIENNSKIGRLERESDALSADIETLQEQLRTAQKRLEDTEAELSGLDLVDTDALRSQIDSASSHNELVRAEKARRDLSRKVAIDKERAEKCTEAMSELDNTKAQALAAAKMPVDGLSFDEQDVLYNSIPFAQASSAEQLRVSLAIAMAANPELKVIRITDGSLLDDDNLQLIRNLSDGQGYQVWIERVGESGSPNAVVIEDGGVKQRRRVVEDIPF